MSITITDPDLLAQLAAAKGAVELKSPTGERVGMFCIEGWYAPPPGFKLPISDEEMEERRKDRSDAGRSLAEIMRDLEARYGR